MSDTDTARNAAQIAYWNSEAGRDRPIPGATVAAAVWAACSHILF
jgi:hypothetical protein